VQEERYGARDRSYSVWHRVNSTKRFVGVEKAQNLSMIDLDAVLWIEYDRDSRVPVALIETAQDVGQPFKPVTVLVELSKLSGLPAFCVLYKLSERRNPTDANYADIEGFRVKRAWPDPERLFQALTPREWAEKLLQIRQFWAKEFDRRTQSQNLFNAG